MNFGREELIALEKLKARARRLELERTEPIAIVGAACRLPGADDLGQLAKLLEEGTDAITTFRAEDGALLAVGTVPGLENFDAAFFGVSPREAERMDPRQRLLLEVSWEALEHAGLPPASLAGGVGVYVGASGNGFAPFLLEHARGNAADAYDVTGTLASVIAGRISHFLGVTGPCMTVDTACSSSLVAVHLACKALRTNECGVAIAGGVGVMPRTRRELTAWRAVGHLSHRGRCGAFDASADGIVGSDGCGIVVLKRLSDATGGGDRILGVIRGSAINHDGRAQGLTVPSGPAQEDVIRRALADARVRPSSVDYVECHGTGTPLGDVIEAQALGQAMREGRDHDKPLFIGSIKSNLGHTDAAAGVVGLLKTILAFERGKIPRSLHCEEPNPLVSWADLQMEVARVEVPWPRRATPRIAGVSSFGISGTNAHVVLHDGPEAATTPAARPRPAELVVLSAESPAALQEVAARVRAHVERSPHETLGDIAFSLATTRTHHAYRVAFAGSSREALLASLDLVGRGEVPRGGAGGCVRASAKVAWLFTGQGAQQLGMGRAIAAEWPVFRETFESVCDVLERHMEGPLARAGDGAAVLETWRDGSLRAVMWPDPSQAKEGALDRTAYAQPALFAFEVALAALWQSWGVEPDLLAGHSVGEIAAAYVAGVFSLEDAARLVVARGRWMQALPEGGAMVSIAVAEDVARAAIAGQGSSVTIAAINGPESVVLSGATSAVTAIGESFAAKGIATKPLAVSHAFHSPLMDPMLGELRRVAESVVYRAPVRQVVSAVTGAVAGPELLTADYWVRHARETVRFASTVGTLHALGASQYIEIGPGPVLLGMLSSCLPEGAEKKLIASLRADRSELVSVFEGLGAHFASGGTPDWRGVFPEGGRRLVLPAYPWQRQRHWIAIEAAAGVAEEPLARKTERDEIAPAPLTRLEHLAEGERMSLLFDLVRAQVAAATGLPPESIDADAELASLGMDSLMGVELREGLELRLGRELPAGDLWLRPSVASIARRLNERVVGSSSAPDRVAHHQIVRPVANPVLRLFCFHDAGGSPRMFEALGGLTTSGIEVHAISHWRALSPTAEVARQYLSEAVAILREHSDRPFALFGHSIGALYAWRVLQRLVQEGGPPPVAYMPSAFAPWALEYLARGAPVDATELFALVFGEGREHLRNVSLRRRDFASDVLVAHALPAGDDEPVAVPIRGLLGSEDALVGERAMREWARYTSASFELAEIPGDHLYLLQERSRPPLVQALLGSLATVAEPAPAKPSSAGTASSVRGSAARIFGTWTLDELVPGHIKLLAGARGQLIYSDAMTMSVLLELDDARVGSSPHPFRTTFSYAGSFAVDESANVITHYLDVSSARLGTTMLLRGFRLEEDGDVLVLLPVEDPGSELRWRRAKSLRRAPVNGVHKKPSGRETRMPLGRIANVALSIVAPTANRFYSALHGPIAPGLPHPSAVEVKTGREPLWVNLGYWRDVAHVDETNVERAAELLESAQRAMAHLLAHTAKLSEKDDVLDCGFGYGDQDILWAEEYHPKSIRGLNVTELQVKVARERVRALGLESKVDLQVGSATDMPVESSSVDVVFALECAFHFKTRQRFFEEAFRVLRPGGRIVLADWFRTSEKKPGLAEAYRHWSGRRLLVLPSDNVCSPRVYEDRMTSVGFAEVKVTSITNDVFRPFWRAIAAITDLHDVGGDSKFPFLWQTAPKSQSAEVSISRVREAAACDSARFVWPQWLGIDEYGLVCATKPQEVS